MISAVALVEVVRLKLLAGLLPQKDRVVGWAGYGEGRPGRCGGCGRQTSVVAYHVVPPYSAEAV